MPPKSKKKKPNGLPKEHSVLRPIDHQRQFKYIPLHIFRKHTNILKLIIKEYETKNNKRPMNFYIKKTLEKYHKKMLKSNDWTNSILKELDFDWPEEQKKIHASICYLDDEEKEKIHNAATLQQKMFLYLPHYLFIDGTNVQELIRQEAIKEGKQITDSKLLKSWASGVHNQLHLISGWHKSFKNLAFKEVASDSLNNEDPVPSTSKQTDPVPSTSKQTDPVPSTSKQTDPVPSTSKQVKAASYTQKRKISSDMSEHDKVRQKSSKSSKISKVLKGPSSEKSPSPPANSKNVDQKSSAVSNRQDEPEIVRSPKRNNPPRYSFGTRRFQNVPSVPWRAPIEPKRIPEYGFDISCFDNPSFAQKTRPTHPSKLNVSPSTIVKRPRSELGGAPVRKQREPANASKQQDASNANELLAQTSHVSTSKKTVSDAGNATNNDNTKEQTSNEIPENGSRENIDVNDDEVLTLPQNIPSGSSSGRMSRMHHRQESCQNVQGSIYKPSDFQAEILQMNFDQFVELTNIMEIIKKEHYKGSDDFSQEDMRIKLKYYYDFREKTTKWHTNAIKNLKRKAQDKEIQTEPTDIPPKVAKLTNQEVPVRSIAYDQESNVSSSQNSPKQTNTSNNNTHRRLQTEEQVGAQAEVQAEVQTTVEQSTIAPVPNNDETQYFSSGTVPDSGQEAIDVLPAMQDVSIVLVPEPEPSIILISDEEVSQAAIPPQSQQILSIEHVRMSELIAHTAPKIEDVIARNPIETQANAIGEISTNQIEQVHEQDAHQSPVCTYEDFSSSTFHITQSTQPPIIQNQMLTLFVEEEQRQGNVSVIDITQINPEASSPVLDTKQEKHTLEYHLGDDSDVEFVEYDGDDIINVSDDTISQVVFDEINKSTNVGETLVIVSTQPNNPEEAEIFRKRLIQTLEGTPDIEDSESSNTYSPLKNVRLQERKEIVTKKRPQNLQPKTKKHKSKNDDLSNIPAPVYNYQPLEFMQVNRRNQIEHSYVQATSVHIEKSQQKPDSSKDYLIEESNDSIQISGNNGIDSDTCVERVNLLNLDNTLFLYINTQPASSDGPSELDQPSINSAQPEANTIPKSAELPQIPLLSKQSSNSSTVNSDRCEFLHYINILNISSKMQNMIYSLEQNLTQLNINTTLQHQCNGNNRIIVTGNAIKLILKLNDEEWGAVHAVLSALKEFQFDSKQCAPKTESLLHRTMYYLFKTTPKISNVYIAYGDQDFETARVFLKPYLLNENVTTAIDPYILSKMKATALQLKNKI